MKKFLFISVAFIYLFLSAGVTVHAHYCMGHFVEIKTPWEKENCGKHESEPVCHKTSEDNHKEPFCCAGKEDNSNCCEDTFFQVKLDIPALGNSTQTFDFKLISILLPVKIIDFSFFPKALFDFNFEFYRPPPILKDIRIITQSLLFYH